jgi:hypothetical protein
LTWDSVGRRVGRRTEHSAANRPTIESEIECVESEWIERDGLRQHVVEVGSTTKGLQQTPVRLSPWLIKPSGANSSEVEIYCSPKEIAMSGTTSFLFSSTTIFWQQGADLMKNLSRTRITNSRRVPHALQLTYSYPH